MKDNYKKLAINEALSIDANASVVINCSTGAIHVTVRVEQVVDAGLPETSKVYTVVAFNSPSFREAYYSLRGIKHLQLAPTFDVR